MSRLTILGLRVDTLQYSVRGSLSPDLAAYLHEQKHEAQDREAPLPFLVDGTELMLQPKGRGSYPWLLKLGPLDIQLTDSAKFPTAYVRLGARGLLSEGAQDFFETSRRLVASLGAHEEPQASRVDVAVDFQGWEFTQGDMAGMVCPANKRALYFGGDQLQTASFGKLPMMFRAYDKTTEIREKRLEWWRVAWAAVDGFDPGERVMRAEVEVGRDVLKQLGIPTVGDVLENANAILGAGLRWCELRVPTGDQTKKRWPVHPVWEQLREAAYLGEPLPRVHEVADLMSEDEAKARAYSALVALAAHRDLSDLDAALAALGPGLKEYIGRGGRDFGVDRELRRRRMLSK